MKKILLSVLVLSFLFCGHSFADKTPGVLTVEADAIVQAKPDKVVFGVGVITRSADLMEAKDKNFKAVRKAAQYCKNAGVAENCIKTDYINISPEWNNYEKLENVYRVEQNLSITLEDISKYDEVLTELLKAGINKVVYMDFQVSELKKYRNEARKLAIRAAKEKGEFLAGETGIKLGKIINIREENSSWFPAGYSNAVSQNVINGASAALSGDYEEPAAGAVFGMVSVRSRVSLTYKIK